MFDLHCHILPGLDDGPAELDTALQMLVMAHQSGTTAIVATPHLIAGDWLPDWEEILLSLQCLQHAAADLGFELRIYPGAEVAMNPELLKKLIAPGPYCINGGKYLLVELPSAEIPDFVDDFLFRLQSRGFIPILAHPERHPLLARNPARLLDWIHRGLLTQINGSSLTGKMGEPAAVLAQLFLKNQLVHFIGSDAHGVTTRRPKLDAAAEKMGKLVGKVTAHRILWENPRLLIQGDRLELPEIGNGINRKNYRYGPLSS